MQDKGTTFRAHHIGINAESVCLATSSITPVIVFWRDVVASMEGGRYCVFISFICVIFWAPNVITKVSVAIVISSLSWVRLLSGVIAWHLNEVCGGIAMTSNVVYVYLIFYGIHKSSKETQLISRLLQ